MNKGISLPLTTFVSVSSEWQSRQSEVLIAKAEDVAARSTMMINITFCIDFSSLTAPERLFSLRRAWQ
jgi:hypothetical protein